MQPTYEGLEWINKPRTQFIKGLPSRLDHLRNDYCNPDKVNACHCELYGGLQRIFDLAKLLGISNISQHEAAMQIAVDAYLKNTDTQPVYSLLANLQQPINTVETFKDFSWPAIPHTSHTQTSSPYIIHLATPCKYDNYLDRHFTLKQYKVSLHDKPQNIARELDAPGKHIIVLDEGICKKNQLNPFDFIAQHKRDNCSFIVFTPESGFQKRLLAARHNTLLIIQPGCDDGVLTQSIEKCITFDKTTHNRVLLVSEDNVLAECIQQILHAAGITLDIITTPSDELLQKLSTTSYDLLLIDYFLQGIYGHELAKIIRQDDLLAQIPITYLCSNTGVECDEHSALVKSDCRIIDTYEPQIIAQTVIDTIAQSSGNRRMGQFMAKAVRENENYRRAIDAHSIISIADVSGRIVEVNQKFCEISGYNRDELIGRDHNIVNSGTHPKEFFTDMWKTITAGKIWRGEICNRKKDGSFYWVKSTIVPFLDDHGKPYQYVSARTDVTHIKQTENSLRINESRLLRSQSFANIGTWDWNLETGSLYWSPRIPPLFGYAEGEVETTYNNFLKTVHPDDRQSVINAANDCIYQGKDYEIEYRCVWPDSTIKWLLERGDVIRDDHGKPLQMLGVVMDITDRKLAEQDNIQQKRLLDMLRNSLNLYLGTHNVHHVAEYMLESLLLLTNSKFGIIGRVCHDQDNKPYLQTHAITNIAWNTETQNLYQVNAEHGLGFHYLDNLLGAVMKTGKPVISNNPAQDPRRGGLPGGHPPLESYLGVPVFYGNELVAMFCLANKKSGYDDDIVESLKPFNVTYSAILQADNMAKTQQETLAELQRSRQDAIDANLAKSQFLSSMSHELRTPLNAILGFTQLLEMNLEQNLSVSQQDSINEIWKAGSHLLELINEVLDLAKIESGKIDLTIEPVHVVSSVMNCVDIVTPLAEKRHISIHWCLNGKLSPASEIINGPFMVAADRLRLKQVILNLLSNAIKYNNENGSIVICITELDANTTRINIRDTGKGIAADKQERLFTSFDRLGEEGSDIEGTGIGLVITSKIVELMHGKLGFRSVEGEGSEFWVDLQNLNDVQAYNADTTIAHTNKPRPAETPKSLSNKVIYIEDNPANMLLVESILKTIDNIELITAHDAYLGYELIKLHLPEIILLDINMPGMNGYEVLDKLRNNTLTRQIPVIAISANAMPANIEKGLKAGFNAYLTKPIVVTQLLDTIISHLPANKNNEAKTTT